MTMLDAGVRYPLEPLLSLMRMSTEEVDQVTKKDPYADHRPRLSIFCQRFNIHREKRERFLAEGLTSDEADLYAAKLGYHPADVWPLWR